MARRFSPERLARDAASGILQLQGSLRDLPTQASQVLVDLDAGRLTLVARDPEASALRDTILAAASRLSLAVVFGSSVIGGLMAIPLSSALATMLFLIAASTFSILLLGLLAPESLELGAWQRGLWRTLRFFTPRRPDPPRNSDVTGRSAPDPVQ